MEAAVGRVLVLAAAGGTHREGRHRRARAVVGTAADDREPGPALRAVEERVAIPAVGRVEQLPQAVVAGGDVGRDQAVRRPPRLSTIAKPVSPGGSHLLDVTVGDPRERRRLG